LLRFARNDAKRQWDWGCPKGGGVKDPKQKNKQTIKTKQQHLNNIPPAGSDVILHADAIIPPNYIADAGTIGIGAEGSLTIHNGAQLHHTGNVEATLQKSIAAYNEAADPTDGWYTIASPVEGWLEPNDNMLTNTYDLYYYNEPDHLWKNYKKQSFDFYNGKGYLYANSDNKTLEFTGNMIPTNNSISFGLFYTEAAGDLKGYNLMGNPFTRNLTAGEITLADIPVTTYYMVEGGSELVPFDLGMHPIKPGQGFFVQAAEDNQLLVLGAQTNSGNRGATQGNLCIEVGNGSVMDRAYVQIGGGNTLRKMILNDNTAKVYVMNDGKDYAAATIEAAQGELPVNFRANENGQYTITVNLEGVEMNYLHLIDNMTGTDIDLLLPPLTGGQGESTPATYTFNARTTDYESRFKLVFSTQVLEPVEGPDQPFAFINNGNLIVNGEGMLQIMDVTGRMIRCTDVARNVSTSGMVPGVYVLRLINGDDVKVQKMVIE